MPPVPSNAIAASASKIGHMADACRRHWFRLSDRSGCLRPALGARLLSRAAVERQSLGPRRILFRPRDAKSSMGCRAAGRRRDRRPFRRAAGAVRRRAALRSGPGADGLFDECGAARPVGWRARRFRSGGLHVPDRARGIRQNIARRMALDRVRSRNGGRLVRPVFVFAARRSAHGPARLAACARRVRHHCVGRIAGVAGAGVAGGGDNARRVPVVASSARRSARAPVLHTVDARLLHLRLSARVHHRSLAGVSCRPRSLVRRRRLDAGGDRTVQHRRLAGFRLARRPHAQALSALAALFRPRRGDLRLHYVSNHAIHLHRVRRGHGPDVALHRAADQRHHRGDVRHPLAGDAVRRYLLQPSGRRLPRRLARRRCVRPHRFLRSGMVVGDPVRRALGADQSADRGEAGPRAAVPA